MVEPLSDSKSGVRLPTTPRLSADPPRLPEFNFEEQTEQAKQAESTTPPSRWEWIRSSSAKVMTKISKGGSPEDAVLNEARGRLIVMGVTRRSGETLSLGHVAEAILADADQPVIFVMS